MKTSELVRLRGKLAASKKIIVAQIQLLYSCNFHCKHCYVEPNKFDAKARGRNLSCTEWKTLLFYLRKREVVFLRISGGEPLTCNFFGDLYEYAWDLGFKIEIATNGYYIDRYFDLFACKKPHGIAMSLYGLQKESYVDFCAGDPNTWDKLQKNIHALQKASVRLQLNFMLNSHNAKDLDAVAAFQSGFETINMACFRKIQCDTDGGAKPLQYMANNEDIVKSYRCFKDYVNVYKEKLQDAWANPYKMCYAGLTSCYVSPYGELFFCNGYQKKKFSIFPEGFEQAWQKVTALRKEIAQASACSDCGKKDFCGMCFPNYRQLQQSGAFATYCENQRNIYRQIEDHL